MDPSENRCGSNSLVPLPYVSLGFQGPCDVAGQTADLCSGHQMAPQDAVAAGVEGPFWQAASAPGPCPPNAGCFAVVLPIKQRSNTGEGCLSLRKHIFHLASQSSRQKFCPGLGSQRPSAGAGPQVSCSGAWEGSWLFCLSWQLLSQAARPKPL